MHRVRWSCLSLVLVGLGLGGCSTAVSPSSLEASAPRGSIALGAIGSGRGDAVLLGAGDALGRELFTYYVASLGLDDRPYYATGESGFVE